MSMIGELRQILPEQMDRLKDRQVVQAIMDGDGLCLEKDWNALHEMLAHGTGESAVMGGLPVDCVDTGYGPPQYMTPEAVAEYAGSLATTTEDDLREEFEDLTDDVYGVPDSVEQLFPAFQELKAYYADAAARGNGMLFFLT